MRHERALKTLEEMESEDAFLRGIEADRGYGKDPNLITPSIPWPGTLSEHQLRLINALSDIILPRNSNYPAPSEIGIAEFFNQWLSAPYRWQKKHREVIVAGLSRIDLISDRLFGAQFLKLNTTQKEKVLNDEIRTSPDSGFFNRFRYLVIGGYFTTDLGSKAIGYVGNIPMEEYSGVSDDIKKMIEIEFKKLNL